MALDQDIGFVSVTKPTQMSRGRAVQFTGSHTQSFPIKRDTVYSIRALIKTTAGTVNTLYITSDAYAPFTITRELPRIDIWVDEYIYYKTEHDATQLTFRVTSSGGNITCGQILIIEGYYPGIYREFSELLFASLTDLGRDGSSTLSTSTIVWDLNTDFDAATLEGTKSLLLSTYIYDTSGTTTSAYQAV